ncbi:MAG: hypothetical protein IC227_08580 [Enterococcus lacertideformus]|uniref:Uncharacterized protein n=1 Tax=Enterococcus lacertideformus TaxID=2771493 RepID=A0A931AW33_9ENTE|nr:hypothetical protein [Enterococcus lacertideformus]
MNEENVLIYGIANRRRKYKKIMNLKYPSRDVSAPYFIDAYNELIKEALEGELKKINILYIKNKE